MFKFTPLIIDLKWLKDMLAYDDYKVNISCIKTLHSLINENYGFHKDAKYLKELLLKIAELNKILESDTVPPEQEEIIALLKNTFAFFAKNVDSGKYSVDPVTKTQVENLTTYLDLADIQMRAFLERIPHIDVDIMEEARRLKYAFQSKYATIANIYRGRSVYNTKYTVVQLEELLKTVETDRAALEQYLDTIE